MTELSPHADSMPLIDSMFTIDTPLGPISTPVGELGRTKKFHEILFDQAAQLSRRSDELRPWVIVGRRGAGKTAFLYHRFFAGSYQHHVPMESAQVFRDISLQIESLLQRDVPTYAPFVENVSELWRAIFITSLIAKVTASIRATPRLHNDPALPVMQQFLDHVGIRRQLSPRSILRQLLRTAERGGDSTLAFIEDHLVNEIGLYDAECALIEFCDRHQQRMMVLIDSVEHFPIDDFRMDAAAGGLLHLLSRLRLAYSPIHLCFCIPSELYHHFATQISTNPEKDFESRLKLQWSAFELIKLSAMRLNTYLARTKGLRRRLPNSLPERPDRADIFAFWGEFLPDKVTNNLGAQEETLAFILRHTQLLPRHIIGIFNEIIRLSLSRDDEILRISEDDIVRGVRLAANSICLGILSSYKQVHPLAGDLCHQILPHLPNEFSLGDFKAVFRNQSRGLVRDYREGINLFKEIGIFGIVYNETGIYYRGEFEYNEPGTMPYKDEDRFCVHPVFASEFRVGRANGGWTGKKVIYPRGTELDET